MRLRRIPPYPTPTVYRYPCPSCRSTNVLHGRNCRFADRRRSAIERAQVEIIAAMATGRKRREELQETVGINWDDLAEASVRMLERDSRVDVDRDQSLELIPPDEIADRIEPVEDPLRTVYEHGSVPGAHDNSVFAMVAYYASKGLTWEDTRRQVINWLEESGTWARGGFEESSPAVLVAGKRHVHEEGYGWLEKATAAKRVIDNSHLVNS